MSRVTHPEDGLVYACPECDSTHLRKRYMAFHNGGDGYGCNDCGAKFTERKLVEREPENHGGGGPSIGPYNDVGQALARPDVTSWDDLADALGGGD